MTTLESQPNQAFWQALETYLSQRIVEQAITTEPVTLTAVIKPASHQRMIDRLSKQINPATPSLNEGLLRRIEWHTNEYQRKTGQLPK
jgi:hypothetical protein